MSWVICQVLVCETHVLLYCKARHVEIMKAQAIAHFQKISMPPLQKELFPGSHPPLEIQISLIHFFGLREPLTPLEIPVFSVGRGEGLGIFRIYTTNSFKLQSCNFERIFKYHLQYKSLIALTFIQ